MRFAMKVAWRYLLSSRLQTALLLSGVAIGVIAVVFITSLLGGLRSYLIKQTTENIPHVTLEPPDQLAAFLPGDPDARQIYVRLKTKDRREQILQWRSAMEIVGRTPGIAAASPVILGGGFILRGQALSPVGIQGVEPDKLDAISPISPKIVRGSGVIDLQAVLVGTTLADDLGLRVGQPVVVRSERGRERTLVVRGIYRTGLGNLDERTAFVHIKTARTLFDLPQGVTEIDIKLGDLNAADVYAAELGAGTGLKATSWISRNKQIFFALDNQARTGTMITFFAMLTIMIGVASALLLTTFRRRSEIGIMRAMGLSRGFILAVFLLQGAFIGLGGALLGSGVGFVLASLLALNSFQSGGTGLPIDPAQGSYLLGIGLTTLCGLLAALLPARAASRIDPMEAINQ
jgi:lipoprotein-releasing system permease protein